MVLAYHAIDDPRSFGRQLDYLARHWNPIGIAELIDAQTGVGLPERSALVTFDDGDRSVLEVAAPMLSERDIPAAAFVVAGFLDSEQPFWWDEVVELVGSPEPSPDGAMRAAAMVRHLKQVSDAERLETLDGLRRRHRRDPNRPRRSHLGAADLAHLEGSGIEIGNHTQSHPCLPRCDSRKVEREIAEAHERLSSILGHAPRTFAYPNGDLDGRAEEVLRRLGYRSAFLFDHRPAKLPVTDPLRISRIRVDSGASVDRFAILLSGLHSRVHHALGRA
jgi:peptidoglycan/xylan/chitin deacetylase (PgdA/CDA1 family)